MNRPVSRRNEAAWREEVRRLARIQEGAKLERERPVEWAAFVALLARGLASAIDPDAPGDGARMEAALRYVREAALFRPPNWPEVR